MKCRLYNVVLKASNYFISQGSAITAFVALADPGDVFPFEFEHKAKQNKQTPEKK